MPAVSVIIPVYNTAPWLEECLTSVMNQTFRDMEIICVNDASTDASSDILATFAQKDDRIRIITQEKNSGQAVARNIGLEKATGEYIYFLDSDDSITLDALERLYRLSMAQKLDIVYFDANPIFETKEYEKQYGAGVFARKRSEYTGRICKGTELFDVFYKNDEWINEVPRQFYSADFLKTNKIRFYNGIIHEDVLFCFQCAAEAERTLYLAERLFNRRFRNNSTMTKKESVKTFCGYFCSAYYINKYVHKINCYTGPFRQYIAWLYAKTVNLYELFQEDACAEVSKLHDRELLSAFYQLEARQSVGRAYGGVSDALVQRLRDYEQVYMYGAGAVAKSVYADLVRKGIAIEGFIVTSKVGNPSVLEGHHVYDLSTFCSMKRHNCIVIIAVKNNQQEIHDILNRISVTNVSYKD